MKLTFHARVQREANEAVRWYEEQKHGLGDEFFTELLHALEHAAAKPEQFSFWLESATVRRVKLRRFPYDVLFEIRPGRVRVLCVRHEKRHPSFGLGRR
jgi:plasmid stabilization system protein ParE